MATLSTEVSKPQHNMTNTSGCIVATTSLNASGSSSSGASSGASSANASGISSNSSNSRDGTVSDTCGIIRLCEVCCESIGEEEEMAGTSKCTHRYCIDCVRRFWEGQVFSGGHARLSCLHVGCSATASDLDARKVLSTRAYRRMHYFRARDADPNASFCPQDGCWAALPCVSGNSSIVECTECGETACVQCEQPAKIGHKCTIARERRALATALWTATHTKACPTCSARIQRARGCAHMTCTRCSAYFCWRCRGYLASECARAPGRRACVCDRLLTVSAYSGLVCLAVLGAPVVVAGAVLAGPPWAIYSLVRRGAREQARADAEQRRRATAISRTIAQEREARIRRRGLMLRTDSGATISSGRRRDSI